MKPSKHARGGAITGHDCLHGGQRATGPERTCDNDPETLGRGAQRNRAKLITPVPKRKLNHDLSSMNLIHTKEKLFSTAKGLDQLEDRRNVDRLPTGTSDGSRLDGVSLPRRETSISPRPHANNSVPGTQAETREAESASTCRWRDVPQETRLERPVMDKSSVQDSEWPWGANGSEAVACRS
ncbi:hypothetical protein NM208_g15410 [Fusarium decemcellulare]|uniref:Uncharacterized protein n=1 Tax=Fusarium decemcellulare TaxID=57161 RepID=A0ACC1REX7_9HYPO|nr:hypothetical protein NM208_g15410 [Fusarium decemcellulare]